MACMTVNAGCAVDEIELDMTAEKFRHPNILMYPVVSTYPKTANRWSGGSSYRTPWREKSDLFRQSLTVIFDWKLVRVFLIFE